MYHVDGELDSETRIMVVESPMAFSEVTFELS